jgi:hypothetical protein
MLLAASGKDRRGETNWGFRLLRNALKSRILKYGVYEKNPREYTRT